MMTKKKIACLLKHGEAPFARLCFDVRRKPDDNMNGCRVQTVDVCSGVFVLTRAGGGADPLGDRSFIPRPPH